jgi:hypothetical protein
MTEWRRYFKDSRGSEVAVGVEGPLGAVHIWRIGFGYKATGGVEFHTRVGVDKGSPCCWLNGDYCKHDGSSLLFDEKFRNYWAEIDEIEESWMDHEAALCKMADSAYAMLKRSIEEVTE